MTNINSFDGTKLYTNFQRPNNPQASVIIVHGLAEHSGRYDYLAEKFHENNIATYRFDHRGHGKSDGERGYYKDFNEIIEDVHEIVKIALKENKDEPVFLLGHSMGGFAVSLFTSKYPDLDLRGIITSGALTHDKAGTFSSIPDGLDPLHKFSNELGPGVCSVDQVVKDYAKDPLNLKEYSAGLVYAIKDGIKWYESKASLNKYSELILHGYDDALVSYEDSMTNFEQISGKDVSLKIYKNLYHEILNEWKKDEVIADIIDWVLTRV